MSESDRAIKQDPIAQSFFVNAPNGMYLTKVGLFFSSKAENDDLPVEVHIRPAFQGYPDPYRILENSVVFKGASEITTSSDASSETTFTFEEPVFVEGGKEYAIVIKSNAKENGYQVWTSVLGNFVVGSTSKRITSQPLSGVFFRSSNGRTFDADQTRDLTYKLYRARFNNQGATAKMKAIPPAPRALITNPFEMTASDATVRVYHPNHGFQVNDYVEISSDSDGLAPTDTINGIKGSSILGKRLITAVDGTGYTFEADSATATATVTAGGSGILATQQFIMDVYKPNIEVQKPPTTNVVVSGNFTTSKSFAGSETAYGSTSNSLVEINKDNFFKNPHVIASKYRDSDLGDASTSFNVFMQTEFDALVAPSIDVQRAGIITVHNVIDYQDSSATSGRNVPLDYIAETDNIGGSSLAKHITRRVDLIDPAVGIKIFVDAYRPSTADFDVYYRTLPAGSSSNIEDEDWVSVDKTEPTSNHSGQAPSTSSDVFREYRYTVGGEFAGTITPFTSYQVKIVMNSQSSTNVPRFKRLRTIALGD